jgi:hypothetical protein
MSINRIVNAVLAFYGGDPPAAWLLTIALFFVIAALLTFRQWRAHEESKQPPRAAGMRPRRIS